MSKRTPNPEQWDAIAHCGGVLLSAGAGSGKTFVLTEHLVHLINEFIKKSNPSSPSDDSSFVSRLRNYLASIVMMTYTKKAAGELELRIKNRITKEAEESTLPQWREVPKALRSLNVTTIHGFCYKLLREGFFTDLVIHSDITSDIVVTKKIDDLFERFVTESKDLTLEKLEYLSVNKKAILPSLVKVLSSAELRLQWKESFKREENLPEDFYVDLYKVKGIYSFLQKPISLSSFKGNEKTGWYQALCEFEQRRESFLSSHPLESLIDLVLKPLPAFRAPSKEELIEAKMLLEQLKKLQELAKKNHDDFKAFQNYPSQMHDVLSLYKSLFSYIDSHYDELGAITFSDLEYLVWQGLQNREARERVGSSYNYFIVDEFQDTSTIQFSIIKKIIGEDFSRLFCVGDPKQAIYGFRGGELAVFNDCKKRISRNLSLKNNYRSTSAVIEFNNILFDDLFCRGLKFEGRDAFTVEVDHQIPPESAQENGHIELIQTELDHKVVQPAALPSLLNRYEAVLILNKMKEITFQSATSEIVILYKNLAPSHYLIEMMIEEKLSFSAQMKVHYWQEPLIYLFTQFIELLMTGVSLESLDISKIKMSGVLYYLGIVKEVSEIVKALEVASATIRTYGVYYSFLKLIQELRIGTSGHGNNLLLLETLTKISGESIEKIYSLFKFNQDNTFSISYNYVGEVSTSITIMTAHSSKGLEFEHVFIGGVHANGKEMANKDLVGQLPGSFRWKISSNERVNFNSPMFILEKEILKQKNFSESKRLFYVAATRAKRSLYLVNLLSLEGAPLKYSENSWVHGLRIFKDSYQGKLNITETSVPSFSLQDGKSITKPLFHRDGLGTFSTQNLGIYYLPELSVTKLSLLTHCPLKFYLKTMCKLDPESFELSENDDESYKELMSSTLLESESFSPPTAYDPMARGSRMHKALSVFYIEKRVDSSLLLNSKDEEAFHFALNYLAPIVNESTIYSEVEMKFALFGQMMTGIPDLYIQDKEGALHIFDFKTGRRDEVKESSYWMQLLAYAFALEEKFQTDKPISMTLLYIDQNVAHSKTHSFTEIVEEITQLWGKLDNLSQQTLTHCPSCEFGKICRTDCTAPDL